MRQRAVPSILLLAILSVLSTGISAGAELKVGEAFPPLEMPKLGDGSRASVADFRGQKLVLHIWASW